MISWFFGTQPSSQLGSANIEGKGEHRLIKGIIDEMSKNPSYLSSLTQPNLTHLKQQFLHSGVDKEHPMLQEIEKIQNNVSTQKPLEEVFISKGNGSTDLALNASNSYIQRGGCLPDETQAELMALAGKLEEISLCSSSDALLDMIATHFPLLKTLRFKENSIYENSSQTIGALTSQGLESLAKLQHLKHFEWQPSREYFVSDDSLQKLFSLPNFQEQLVTLKISNLHISDALASILNQYHNLIEFDLDISGSSSDGGVTTPQILVKLFQSTNLSASLKKLTLHAGTIYPLNWTFSDSSYFIHYLCSYRNLRHLDLSARGALFSSLEMQTLLTALKELETFLFDAVPFDDLMCYSMREMTGLKTLALKDCSKMSDEGYFALMQGKVFLQELSLGNALVVNDTSKLLNQIAEIPNLQKLSLDRVNFTDGLEALCTANTQKELQSLSLSNIPLAARKFGSLTKLTALTALKVDNCCKFNDESLRLLAESRLRNTLRVLELKDVSTSHFAINLLAKLELEHLAVIRSPAWTYMDYSSLLKNGILHRTLKTLCLDEAAISDKDANAFKEFFNLRALLLANSSLTPYGAGMNTISRLAKDNNLQLLIANGETDVSKLFERAVAECNVA